MKMKRYDVIFEELSRRIQEPSTRTQPLNYVDIGVYDGKRAISLIKHWLSLSPRPIRYTGFDLFAELTDAEKNAAEFAKKVLPPSIKSVKALFDKELAGFGDRVSVTLVAGDTRQSLWDDTDRAPWHEADVINIDGGHSLETVQNDWDAASDILAPGGTILLDDYYENRDDFGCRRLVDSLAGVPDFVVTIHKDKMDVIPDSGLKISYVSVRLAPRPVVEPVPEPVIEPESSHADPDTDAE